jgi:general secretion pathway protein J
MTRRSDAGFTLIEVLVSLALFALIAGAGLSVLDQILRTQSQTDGRLDRLASLQRMMHLVARDMSEAMPGTVQGDAATITVGRIAEVGRVTITYALTGGQMTRSVTQSRGQTVAQVLLTDVQAMQWQYLTDAGGWQGVWPDSTADPDLRAVGMVVSLPPGDGDLRRIVAVPRAGRP